MKKARFYWVGFLRSGQRIKGQAYEFNADLLRLKLARQGFYKLKIRRQIHFIQKKARYKDITDFARQLSIMLKSGLPLLKALEVLSASFGPLQNVVSSVQKDIEQGKALAEAFRRFPRYFDHLFCGLIELGEVAGVLDSVLLNLVSYREKAQKLKAAVLKALSYPVIVLAIAVSISIGLLIFIVPQFQNLFAEFNAPLPLLTRIVVRLSHTLKQHGVLLALAMTGFTGILLLLKKRSERFKHYWDKALLNLPVLGKLIQKAFLIRMSRTLSLMLCAGMPLAQALALLSQSFGNKSYRFAMTKTCELLKNGQAFNQALQQTDRFPALLIQMVQVGEESGTLDSMLDKAADVYQEELDDAVDMLKELLEPFIMIVLGIVVGSLVIAMYLPVFNLGGVMSA